MFSLPPQPPWEGMHPLVIHFPIGLLFVVPVFVLLAGFLGSYGRWFGLTALLLLIMGTVGAMVAVDTGDAAYDAVMELDDDDGWDVIEEHGEAAKEVTQWYQGLCIAYLILFIGPFLLRKLNNLGYWLPANLIFLVALMFVNLHLAKAAHIGGRLVHQYGAKAVLGVEEADDEASDEASDEDVADDADDEDSEEEFAEEESSDDTEDAMSVEEDAAEEMAETEEVAEETSEETVVTEEVPEESASEDPAAEEGLSEEGTGEEMIESSDETPEEEVGTDESVEEETTDLPTPEETETNTPPVEETPTE